jgi:hypothetical protein
VVCNRFLPEKSCFYPPPKMAGIISTPKIGGGVPPLSKNRPLRQAKFILARLLAPYAQVRGLGQKTLWYTPPPAPCKALGGLLGAFFVILTPPPPSGKNAVFRHFRGFRENLDFSCFLAFFSCFLRKNHKKVIKSPVGTLWILKCF